MQRFQNSSLDNCMSIYFCFIFSLYVFKVLSKENESILLCVYRVWIGFHVKMFDTLAQTPAVSLKHFLLHRTKFSTYIHTHTHKHHWFVCVYVFLPLDLLNNLEACVWCCVSVYDIYRQRKYLDRSKSICMPKIAPIPI